MTKKVIELSEEEKALAIKHLNGLSALYISVNGSEAGPVSSLIEHIKGSQLVIEFDYPMIKAFLRHLKGASSYDKIVYGSDPLNSILNKIERA